MFYRTFLRLLLISQLSIVAKPEDEFADVNSILKEVAIKMPNVPTMSSGGYSIDLTEVICRDISIRDASLTSRSVGLGSSSTTVPSSGVQLQWTIEGLTFKCDAKYRYKGLLGMVNEGDVYLYSRDNRAVTTATVSALLSGSPQPPTEIAMNSCTPEVEIVDVDFDNGGIFGWILDTIEGMLRSAMENIAEDKICNELQAFLETNTKDLLEYIAGEDGLKPYLPAATGAAESIPVDTMELEKEFINNLNLQLAPPTKSTNHFSTTELLTFQQQDTSMGSWMNEMIQRGVLASNELVHSDNGVVKELQVNQWLRDFVLDDDGALVLTSSSVGPEGFPMDGMLYDDQDLVTHTTIVLDRVKLLGLDTLIQFSPFKVAGDYSLETNLAWKYLALEADVSVTVRPSTRPDSVIESTGSSTTIVEKVKVMLGVDGLTAGASLMVALNQTAIENSIQFGSLLKSNKAAVDCLLSTVLDLEFSTLSVKVTNDILTPSIEGLVSPGLDRIVSQAMDACFLMYEKILLEAAPTYFQNALRPLLTQKILHEYLLERGTTVETNGERSRTCTPLSSNVVGSNDDPTRKVDFRDLLLPVEESRALGGSGSEAYGDLFSGLIMPYVYEELLDPETLNTQWIRRITKEQSGKEGVLEFNDVFRYLDKSSKSPLYDGLDLRISRISITNVDTMKAPLELMQPTDEGNILQNRFTMSGSADDTGKFRYLNATFRVYVGILGDDSPIQMSNEVDLSVSIPATSLSLSVLADMEERSLLEFPLKDIANPYCWLAAFSDDGKVGGKKNFDISSISFSFVTLYLDSRCISATSPGCNSIAEVIGQMEDAGFARLFQEPIIGLVENVASSIWNAMDFEELIAEAPMHCPHSNYYDDQTVAPRLGIRSVSGMSMNSAETVFALNVVGLQAAMVVSAKNHLLLAKQQLSPTAGQMISTSSNLQSFPEGKGIIDWTNLSRFGTWVDFAFDEFRNYLSKPAIVSNDDEIFSRTLSAEMTPRINRLLQEYVLDDGGVLDLGAKHLSFTTMGITISIVKVKLRGLDTINAIEPFIVLDPHKLSTRVRLDRLEVMFECNVTTTTDAMAGPIELVYKAKDIELDIDKRLAINTTEIGKVQIGSIFNISQIINCMMKGVHAVEISKLNLIFGEVTLPTIDGPLSSEVQSALNAIFDSLQDTYREEILEAIPLIAGSTMREVINSLIPDILDSMVLSCPSPPKFPSTGVIDFRDLFFPGEKSTKIGGSKTEPYGDIFQLMYSTLDEEVMKTGASNRPTLNDWLKTLTTKQSGTSGQILVSGSALDTTSLVQIAGLKADLRMEVSDVLIENIDSIGDPLYFFVPVTGEPNVLDNKLSFGTDSKPLRFEGTFSLSLDDGAEMKIKNDVYISFLVEDVSVQTSIALKILENSISSFPLQDVSDIHCWIATILPSSNRGEIFEGIKLLGQSYSTGHSEMDISCKSCTSPDFDKLLSSLYEPQDITGAIREQTSSLMESGFVQSFLHDMVFESKKRCPHRLEFDPNFVSMNEEDIFVLSDPTSAFVRSEQTKNPMYFSIANSVVAGCLIIAGILGKVMLASRNRKWIKSLSIEGQFFFDCQRGKQQAMNDWLDANTTSLFTSSSIPKSVRWGVPVLIILNAGLYLGGHLGLLSVVNLDITLAGQSFTIHNFLEFRFLDSTWNSYQNGGAEMVVLLWIFTGIWPYIKLFLSLAIWMVPPKHLGVQRRGTMLLWIDALARLSVIDIFTLLIGFAVLLVFIGGRDTPINGDGVYYALKAIVVPKAGCYCIIVAQRMSRASSQFLLEYHGSIVNKAIDTRKNTHGDMSISQVITEHQIGPNCSFEIESPSIRVGGTSSTEESLCALDTTIDLSQVPNTLSILRRSSWRVYRWGHLGAILGGVTILIVFIIGCVFVPAIAFDISTIGGITLESDYTYDEAVSEYGVFVVISGILLKARFVLKNKADYIGLGLLLVAAGVTISSTFIIKVFQFIRRKIQQRRDTWNCTEQKPSYGHEGCGLPSYFRLYKWMHMEIFFISVCIGVWQLGSIISYSIHLYCSILTSVFDTLASIGVVEPTKAHCNRIQALLPGNLIITLGSLLILLASFYLQAREQYKRNLAKASEEIDDKDVPTLSLAWSHDKSKNTRYSHLTGSLSFSAFDDNTISSRAGRTTVGIMPKSISTRVSRSFRQYLNESLSFDRSESSIQPRPSRNTINEDDNEYEVSVPIASPIIDDASLTIDAACELVNPTNHNRPTNIGSQFHQGFPTSSFPPRPAQYNAEEIE